jgi:CRP-like cAMP-binding protein
LGDRLGPDQVGGGALVIASVLILEVPGPSPWIAWLPLSERWALRATRAWDVPAGAHAVAQGDVADAFFVIEEGRALVVRDGHAIADLNPGDFFGEVALLRGGVRTASVVAATDLRLRIVPGHEFEGWMRRLPNLSNAVSRVVPHRLPAPSIQLALEA